MHFADVIEIERTLFPRETVSSLEEREETNLKSLVHSRKRYEKGGKSGDPQGMAEEMAKKPQRLRTVYGLGGECVAWTEIKVGGPLPCKL
jgi:hypothetical protein